MERSRQLGWAHGGTTKCDGMWTDQLRALRQVFTLCLALADEMKDGTIDQILAKDDVELAIEFLMGKRKL